MRAFIRRLRAQVRMRLAWHELRDEFADHRLAMVSPYDDQCIIERWEDVVADIETALACKGEGTFWFDELLRSSALWRDLIGDDDSEPEYA